jgi:phospholipid/cholesterol/gamma-HCH transport system substrate-binding protein
VAALTRTERVQAILFLLIGLVLVASVILTLVGIDLGPKPKTYYLRFTSSVKVLDENTPVHYKGKRYGKISSIEVNPEDPEEMVVTIAVDPECPVKVSTTAQISSSTLLGPYYIDLLDSRKDSPDLPSFSDIPASPSTMSRLLKAGETVGDELVVILKNLEDLTRPERIEGFWKAIDDLRAGLQAARTAIDRIAPDASETLAAWRRVGETVDAMLNENREGIAELVRNVSATAKGVNRLLESGEIEGLSEATKSMMDRLASELERDGEALRAWLDRNDVAPSVQTATAAFVAATADLQRLAKVIEAESVGLTHGELAPALADLRAAATAFLRMTELLQRNPRALLFGEPPAEKPLPAHPGANR